MPLILGAFMCLYVGMQVVAIIIVAVVYIYFNLDHAITKIND